MIHVKDHGAIGDGVTDDTDAILSALSSGEPIEWGDSANTYRVTQPISVTPASPVSWTSRGATILCDAPQPVVNVVDFELAGHSLHIEGKLIIDAARNAFTCLHVRNAGDSTDVRITDVHAVNAYRSSQQHNGGDGIWLRGAFRTVTLDRPVVRNIAMAEGAGIPGSQGISGITVSAHESYMPGDVLIVAPYIDGVLSEDTTYDMDQDGIRVMTANPFTPLPYESHFRIIGGTIRNAGCRSVKSQADWTVVDGVRAHRDVTRVTPGREFDFQKGGGTLINVAVQYEATPAETVAFFDGSRMDGEVSPAGTVDGLKVILAEGESIEQAVLMRDQSSEGATLICRGIDISGGTADALIRLSGTGGGAVRAVVTDCMGEFTGSAARIHARDATPWSGNLVLSNIINTGPAAPAIASSGVASVGPAVRASTLVGFTGTPSAVTERLDLAPIITGWAEVDEDGCAAYRSSGTITYTLKLRGPSDTRVIRMGPVPDGWKPARASIAQLKSFNRGDDLGDVFIGTDGHLTAYRAQESPSWSYTSITLPAA